MHSPRNVLIAVIAIALFAMAASYFITRVSSTDEYSGSNAIHNALNEGDFSPFDGASTSNARY